MQNIRKEDYEVRHTSLAVARDLVEKFHYAQGGSNTATDVHGLYLREAPDECLGVAWWLPPTRVAAESVNKDEWKRVVSLSRLVVVPGVPCGGASFLLGRSIRLLKQDARWASLVTYADEFRGHTGQIYKATNWQYVGRTGPYTRWEDADGRQVAVKATKNRTKAQMLALGNIQAGRYYKHKFVMHLQTSEKCGSILSLVGQDK